jgi:Tfp pilus assembly protein PilN
MTQQINLCNPVLLTQKRYFSALVMLRAYLGFMVLLSATCGYWVWQLDTERDAFIVAVKTQSSELKILQDSLGKIKLDAGAAVKGLSQDLQAQRLKQLQREQLLAALNKGHFQAGAGHASRLKLVAQSIPAKVWLTEIKADDGLLQLSGFTLETALLNEWMRRLENSPALIGQKLSFIKVEQSTAPSAKSVWNFTMTTALAKPLPPAGGTP